MASLSALTRRVLRLSVRTRGRKHLRTTQTQMPNVAALAARTTLCVVCIARALCPARPHGRCTPGVILCRLRAAGVVVWHVSLPRQACEHRQPTARVREGGSRGPAHARTRPRPACRSPTVVQAVSRVHPFVLHHDARTGGGRIRRRGAFVFSAASRARSRWYGPGEGVCARLGSRHRMHVRRERGSWDARDTQTKISARRTKRVYIAGDDRLCSSSGLPCSCVSFALCTLHSALYALLRTLRRRGVVAH